MKPTSSYDDWKTSPPDTGSITGRGVDIEAALRHTFWQFLKVARRHGTAEAYLDRYRGTQRFGALVEEAESEGRCQQCYRRLERDPVMGTHTAPCEDCRGGEE